MSSELENGILGEITLDNPIFCDELVPPTPAVFGPLFYLAFLAVPVYVQPQFF